MEKIYHAYPELGETTRSRKPLPCQRIKKIALPLIYKGGLILGCASVAFGAALAFSASPILPAVLAAGACASLLILVDLVKRIYHTLFTHAFFCDLPEEIRKKNHSGGPKVGTYSPCSVLVLNSTEEIFQKKLEMISLAEDSIECSFNIGGGAPLDRWLNQLNDRLKAKPLLKVHLMISQDMLTKSNRSRLRELKSYEHFYYLVTDRHLSMKHGTFRTEENHLKALIIDEKYFISGGSNLGEPFVKDTINPDFSPQKIEDYVLPQGFRDTDFIGKGKLAKTLRSQFFNLYQIWMVRSGKKPKKSEGVCFSVDTDKTTFPSFERDPRKRENVLTKLVVSGPEHRGYNPITQEYLTLIREAQKTIILSNLYFSPPPQVIRALEKKKNLPNIEVIGHFNGTRSNGKYLNLEKVCGIVSKYLLSSPARAFYRSSFDRVYEFSKKSVGKHKKVAVFDNRIGVIGSYNFGVKSHECDYEMAFVFVSSEVADDILEGIEEDKKDSKVIQTEKYRPSLIDKTLGLASDFILKGIAF